MSYLVPAEFAAKMVDAGESKIFMSTRDTLIRTVDKLEMYHALIAAKARRHAGTQARKDLS